MWYVELTYVLAVAHSIKFLVSIFIFFIKFISKLFCMGLLKLTYINFAASVQYTDICLLPFSKLKRLGIGFIM